MAIPNLRADSALANITIADLRQIASALVRLNQIDAAPVLSVEDRKEVSEAKRLCWSVVGSAAESLVELMNAMAGDPDIEDATGDEDAFEQHESHAGYGGPGCALSDPGEDNGDREAIDEREPEEGY